MQASAAYVQRRWASPCPSTGLFLHLQMGGLGQPNVGHLGGVCVSDSLLPWGLARGCQARERWRRGLLHPLDDEAQVQSGDVTYFPRLPAFPCGSFLVAQALLEGDASPCGGLCQGARWGGREVRVSGPE